MSHYFITGATGVVGSAVVRALLEDSDSTMTLLVRAGTRESARERVNHLLRFLECCRESASGRIEPLIGDVEKDRLGLEPEDYRRVCAAVTNVIHCAAMVRMNLPLADARRAAVAATRNVFEFAAACLESGQLRKLESVSTVGVGGRWKGAVPERWIEEDRAFHNTYEQAKAEAEVVAREYVARGLPVTVHRPSMVVGDSSTGRVVHFQIFYHLAEFLSGRRTFGLMPPIQGRHVDLVPADYVAKSIVWSSGSPKCNGKVLHLCAGAEGAVPLEELQSRVRTSFARSHVRLPTLRTVPVSAFSWAVRAASPFASARTRRAIATLPIFLDYLSEDQDFANQQTRALLESAGIRLPQPKHFLDPVLSYYLARVHGMYAEQP